MERLKARVLEQVRREPAPTRDDRSRKHRLLIGAMLLVPALVFVALGGVRPMTRPTELLLENVAGSLVLAIVIGRLALSRGNSMLGRPRSWLTLLVLSTPLVLFSWRVLVSGRYSDAMLEWPERPGVRCLLLSMALSAVPLLGLLAMRRNSEPVHPHLTAAGLAAGVGAGTWVLVDLWCPVSYVPHLLLGHVLPLLLLLLAGGLLGGRVLALRSRAVSQFGSSQRPAAEP
jgi:hypothetical protein